MVDDSKQLEPYEFVRLVLATQRRLYGLVRTLLPNCSDVDDIVQDVVTLMWQKISEFEPGTNFSAWACRIAHLKVLEFRRRENQGHIFDLDLINSLAQDMSTAAAELEARSTALEECVEALPVSERELVLMRFREASSVKATALHIGRSEVTVRTMLRSVFTKLEACIQARLGGAL